MIEISGRQVGAGRPCFIIAEAGVNHNGDRMKALELVDVADLLDELGIAVFKIPSGEITNLPPFMLSQLLGQIVTRDLGEGTLIQLKHVREKPTYDG